jgi:MFS family permease
MAYRYFGLLATAVLVIAYGAALYLLPRNRAWSLSQHIAERKRTYLLTAVAFTVYAGLMYVFFSQWLMAALQLPTAFMILVVLSTLGALITGWVPDTTQPLKRYVHRLAAYGGLAFMVYCITLFIVIFGKLNRLLWLWALLVVVFMTYCALLYVFDKSVRKHYLIYQSAYVLSFYSLLAGITFLA